MLRRLLIPACLLAAGCAAHPVSTKQDGAQASRQTQKAGSTAVAAALPRLATQAPGSTVTVQGHDGSADVTLDATATSGAAVDSAHFAAKVVFHGYSCDGKAFFDGTVTLAVDATAQQGAAAATATLRGTVTESGSYDSTLVFDESLAVSAAQDPSGGRVSVTLTGTLGAGSAKFTYAGDVFVVAG